MADSYKRWFLLYTKPRHEFKAEQQLNNLNIENYLPTFTKMKQWSDRKKKVTEPLFNGYIFIYGGESERLLALQQHAIVRSIFFEGKPAVVPQWQIENLKNLLAGKPDVTITDVIEAGTRVKVVSGPFSGVIGIVNDATQSDRTLAITIDFIHRSVIVRLPIQSITKIKDN